MRVLRAAIPLVPGSIAGQRPAVVRARTCSNGVGLQSLKMQSIALTNGRSRGQMAVCCEIAAPCMSRLHFEVNLDTLLPIRGRKPSSTMPFLCGRAEMGFHGSLSTSMAA